MIVIKRPEEIDRMRESGRLAAVVLAELGARVTPGMTTAELDAEAERRISRAGARSAFLGYRGYPGHVCISINDEVVHGIPGVRRIEIGDIVSIDVGVVLNGYVGDTAATFMVGVTEAARIRLVRVAQRALEEGIRKAVVGGRLSDISHAIEQTVEEGGFTVVREFVGHGVGRSMHEDPQIPNFGPPGCGPRLRPGMTLAIEPMVNMGRGAVVVQADGWTVKTEDGMPSAHFEHTVAILADGPEILTRAE